MPYEQPISRQHKACLLFLVNQSRTMLEPIGDGERRKCDEAASQVNSWLQNMTIRATGSDGIRDWMDLGVLGYRTDEEGKPIIESAFQGALAGRPLVSVVDVGEHPLRIEQVVQRFFDEETGESFEVGSQRPVWVDPKAEGGAPMCRALHEAFQVLEGWISDEYHYYSFPPIVIHITDGQSDDGDPTAYADALKDLATSDGNVLLFNCHFSRSAADRVIFPSSRDTLPDAAARLSFDISSVLPKPFWDMDVAEGFELQPGARGILNAEMAICLIKFFNMGTRVAGLAPEDFPSEYREPVEDIARGDFATGEMPEDIDAAPPAAETLDTAFAAEAEQETLLDQIIPATRLDEAPRCEEMLSALVRAALGREPPHPLDENVQFSVYRPGTVQPERWYLLLAFAHLSERRPDAPEDEPDPVEEVQRQARLVLEKKFDEYVDLRADAEQAVPREGELTFVPQIPGVQFNPPSRSFFWTEPVHREEFRLRASAGLDGQTARGRLTVFLGSVIVAEVSLAIRVDGGHRAEPSASPTDVAFGRPYRKIFASYSHQDVAIVEEFEQYFKTVGDRYLRDWIDLRAGEAWCERLEELIREADVFQLFWSTNAMRSRFVRQEWEYALALGRPYFVRPVYWEEPMPSDPAEKLPPEALLRLHFQRLPSAGGPHAPPAPGAAEPVQTSSTRHARTPRSATDRIMVACPKCGKRYGAHIASAGKQATCRSCSVTFTIPGGSAAPSVPTRGEPRPESGLGTHEKALKRKATPPPPQRARQTTSASGAEPESPPVHRTSTAEGRFPWDDVEERPTSTVSSGNDVGRRTSTAQIETPGSYREPIRTSTLEEGPPLRGRGMGTAAPIGCVVLIILAGGYLAYRLVMELLSLFW